jgi:thymidine phosphorylase
MTTALAVGTVWFAVSIPLGMWIGRALGHAGGTR